MQLYCAALEWTTSCGVHLLTLSLRVVSLKPETVFMVIAGLRSVRQTLIAAIQQLGDFSAVRIGFSHFVVFNLCCNLCL